MARTRESGAALLANDMHLSIARADHLVSRVDGVSRSRAAVDQPAITGVTLPGLPGLVVGSNGHVAWGFTNTGGDWSDLVRIEPDPRDAEEIPDARRAESRSRCSAKRSPPRARPAKTVPIRWTIWGPIVWKDARGREYAQRWVAHDARRARLRHHQAGARAIGRRSAAGRRRPRHPESERDDGRYERAGSRGRSAARFRSASATTA